MPEGPEVKRNTDFLNRQLSGKQIEEIKRRQEEERLKRMAEIQAAEAKRKQDEENMRREQQQRSHIPTPPSSGGGPFNHQQQQQWGQQQQQQYYPMVVERKWPTKTMLVVPKILDFERPESTNPTPLQPKRWIYFLLFVFVFVLWVETGQL